MLSSVLLLSDSWKCSRYRHSDAIRVINQILVLITVISSVTVNHREISKCDSSLPLTSSIQIQVRFAKSEPPWLRGLIAD